MMPKPPTSKAAVLLALAMALVVLLGSAAWHRLNSRDWGSYRPPAPPGPQEARIQQLMRSAAPAEQRFEGLFQYFSDGFLRHSALGHSRVQYPGAGSGDGYRLDGLEGFARVAPLLAAWVYSGRDPHLADSRDGQVLNVVDLLREGLLRGVDPSSVDYWGDVGPDDQRIVEAADLSRVLWLTRRSLWSTLSSAQKAQVSHWLLMAARQRTPADNWMLFPVLIELIVMDLDGQGAHPGLLRQAQDTFRRYHRNYYLDNGWFTDPPNGVDYYNTWGITYDLFWIHTVAGQFEPDVIVPILRESAQLTRHLIGPRGIPIMGRSICYRTAVPVPVVVDTFLDSSEVTMGSGLTALDEVWRYFVAHDALRDGALSQGYFKDDLRFLDPYSGSGSCHWGLRSLVLAFMHPAGSAFWTAPAQPLPVEQADYRLDLPKLGWIITGTRRTAEIVISIPANKAEVISPESYSWAARSWERLLRRPLRPHNHAIKYDLRRYSSTTPFPLVGAVGNEPRTTTTDLPR